MIFCNQDISKTITVGAQWLSGRLIDETERPRVRATLRCGHGARHIYPSLELVQPRKTRPCLTKRLLMGRKESNQTNKRTAMSFKLGQVIEDKE